MNEALIRDTTEARELAFGRPGDPRTSGVVATLDYIREPTARTWYRAHNTSIASAYLGHEDLARREGLVERFFLDLVLVRVPYAHALVAASRLALGWLAPLGRLYEWSAGELGLPALDALLARPGPTPSYAWDPGDAEVWHPVPSRLARAALRAVPAPRPP